MRGRNPTRHRLSDSRQYHHGPTRHAARTAWSHRVGRVAGAARYAVVGRGWRADFYTRLAATMPERFTVTGVAGRGDDLASLVRDGRPEFVVTSVPWSANPSLVERLVDLGVAVLSETPPAP